MRDVLGDCSAMPDTAETGDSLQAPLSTPPLQDRAVHVSLAPSFSAELPGDSRRACCSPNSPAGGDRGRGSLMLPLWRKQGQASGHLVAKVPAQGGLAKDVVRPRQWGTKQS